MTSGLRKFAEAPTATSSLPPPPGGLRKLDRLATIGWVSTGIFHELATKLEAARVHADRLASGDLAAESARAGVQVIAQQVAHMRDRVRRLLEFTREQATEQARVDMWALARHATELFVPLAARCEVTIRMASGAPLEVDGDVVLLEQVVAALVHNAIQACSPGGSVAVSVLEGTGDAVDHICLDVVDDGAGIRREDQVRIFEPFFTTKDVEDGTGLGLSVAEAIVRDHGGWIGVESTPGSGSRFRVHLPRNPRVLPDATADEDGTR